MAKYQLLERAFIWAENTTGPALYSPGSIVEVSGGTIPGPFMIPAGDGAQEPVGGVEFAQNWGPTQIPYPNRYM